MKHVLVVRAAGVQSAIRQLRGQHQAEVARHPDVSRYLRDRAPFLAAKVAQCGTKARVARDRAQADRYRVRLYGCHIEPWCTACVREALHRRAGKVLDRFYRCRPAAAEPRFAHIVQTAQLREEDGSGWGAYAAKDVAGFADVIWRTLRESYGSGIGAFLSYQAFGERAFGKTHPHIDLTINGWHLVDGQATRLQPYDLSGNGHARWVQRTRDHAGARFLIEPNSVQTNLKIQGFVDGPKAYRAALLYQLRELVDVRKMTYDRPNGLVYWNSYRDNRRERMTLREFEEGLVEYQANVGAWGAMQSRHLHRAMGHMADAAIGKTTRAMGGETPDHRANCSCGECTDWELVQPDPDGRYDFDPWHENSPTAAGFPLAVP